MMKEVIKMTEQQIKDEMLRYLRDDSYNYAILIDGEWRRGKTYFVKNTLSKDISAQEACSEDPREVSIFPYMVVKVYPMFKKILLGHLQKMLEIKLMK